MSQKVCVIVGFGTGVSAGVAKVFGKEGYTLALVARNPAKLADNAQVLIAEGFSVQTFTADAGDEASLIQAFTRIRAELGDPEVLIYNAAGFTPGKPSSLTSQGLVADFQVNVAGALAAVQQVLMAMQANRKGTILLTGGGLALYPAAEASSLSIGKAGIRSLAFTLAQELQESGIHVGTVTICGTVQSGTHFDPDAIAQSYLALHHQLPAAFETEVIYK
ncbi:SDR family NAD(P)-dependent oxidoreductase [Nodosilinea sp. LEGE 07088]|uniref:SDR family NAD(P)-dependent oxidoreductase n=1 Tax=Nodosilinea sp. LEGE 07088 TaxID=2777968 RepID=UPI001880A142|nr:SDR family NAD(P)-dependent oxidoreductase [Nodosilinea sp. LEGE 07088]MBE9140710.1 SDR family NAD(P)-dependent oxidoreductase [Nodosilinea sp. LEGE 07088]